MSNVNCIIGFLISLHDKGSYVKWLQAVIYNHHFQLISKSLKDGGERKRERKLLSLEKIAV